MSLQGPSQTDTPNEPMHRKRPPALSGVVCFFLGACLAVGIAGWTKSDNSKSRPGKSIQVTISAAKLTAPELSRLAQAQPLQVGLP